MSPVSAQFQQLKDLLAQLEESAIEHAVDSPEAVLEALELAGLIEIYENEATSLLLQTSANLIERVKDHELGNADLQQVIDKLREVGYTDVEIKIALALEQSDPEPEGDSP